MVPAPPFWWSWSAVYRASSRLLMVGKCLVFPNGRGIFMGTDVLSAAWLPRGEVATNELGVEHETDHGSSHSRAWHWPSAHCLADGMQIATGATYGKSLMEKTFWGKLAAVFYFPEKGAVRLALRADFLDEFGKREFFAQRMKGIEPSLVAPNITEKAINWTDAQQDEKVFKIERLPDYQFKRVKGSFSKAKCVKCGEYVFERYVRMVNGLPHCTPSSATSCRRLRVNLAFEGERIPWKRFG